MDAFEGNEIHKAERESLHHPENEKTFCVVVAILNFKYAVN